MEKGTLKQRAGRAKSNRLVTGERVLTLLCAASNCLSVVVCRLFCILSAKDITKLFGTDTDEQYEEHIAEQHSTLRSNGKLFNRGEQTA